MSRFQQLSLSFCHLSSQFSSVFSRSRGAAEKHSATFSPARLVKYLTSPSHLAILLVSRKGVRHVLPHQKVRTTFLSANRRKPLARRRASADRPGYVGPARQAANQ